MSVVIDGRPIVAGERRRVITFDKLDYDWHGAGYTAVARIENPKTGSTADWPLSVVGGDPLAARLPDTIGVFPVEGPYKTRLIAFESGGVEIALASEDYSIEVSP